MGGFANSLMLLFGFAAAIPVIIHLWNRRRFREIDWAAMEYLLAALRKHARRIRIEQLILLAVRVAVLIALTVALADPYLNAGLRLASGSKTGHTHWVMVIDASYSMDYRDQGSSRFEQARQQVRRLLDKATQGDGFTLILMADPPRTVIREPAFSTNDVEDELQTIQLPHGGGDLTATLAEVQNIVGSAQRKVPRLTATKVCIFTDLGTTTWAAVGKRECRRRVAELANVASLYVLDQGSMGGVNLSVTELSSNDPLATVGREMVFTADIQNHAAQDQQQMRVELFVDAGKVDEQRVNVPSLGRAAAAFPFRFSAPGDHVVEVRIAEDVLPVDNHRWLSVPVRSSIRVLCVEGIPGAARNAAIALEPGATAYRRIETSVIPETALLDQSFEQYQCVLLCNVRRFSAETAERMRAFVEQGGGLIITLGDQVDADNYNRWLAAADAAESVLPATVGDSVPLGRYQFDPLQHKHPIVAPFRDHSEAGLLSSPVWKYRKLNLLDEETVQRALAFENGDPAIVTRAFGKGHVVIYAGAVSSLSLDRTADPPAPWTAIHTWPSFPPLMQEMMTAAIRGQTQRQNLTVGQTLHGVVAGVVADVPLEVETPIGDRRRVQLSVEDGDSHWQFGRVERSGVYLARFGAPLSVDRRYAANLDTRESDLQRLDTEELPSQFGVEVDFESAVGDRTVVVKQTKVFQYALAALLALLILESILAWHFGRARVKTRAMV